MILHSLNHFDPIASYPHVSDALVLDSENREQELANITSLLVEMIMKSAGPFDMARVVRHSMVILDAEKHKLNYSLSFVDNGIEELIKKYL